MISDRASISHNGESNLKAMHLSSKAQGKSSFSEPPSLSFSHGGKFSFAYVTSSEYAIVFLKLESVARCLFVDISSEPLCPVSSYF